MLIIPIGGLQKSSLIDYPEKISAIIFTQGCNFRCPYCHNPELINFSTDSSIDESVLFNFLKTRINKLDAVVITGGEPTLHKGLPEFIKQIKDLGFLVKLDTNGTNPEMLQELLDKKLIDYVAMDIKAPIEKYSEIVCAKVDTGNILKSIDLLKETKAAALNSSPHPNPPPQGREGIKKSATTFFDFEFRTTVVKSQLSPEDFGKIGEMIKGSEKYYLQKFVPTKALNQEFLKETTYSDAEFSPIIKTLEKYINCVELR